MKIATILFVTVLSTAISCTPPAQNVWYSDFDSDGFGDSANFIIAEEKPVQYVKNRTDCDDDDPNNFPGNIEVEDGSDNNCNGQIDETRTWYEDGDSDGFGDINNAVDSVLQPSGYVTNNSDCDDSDSNSFPGNSETYDGADNNCDGVIDEGIPTSVHTVPAFPNLNQSLRLAVFITHANDQSNRLFVVRKHGSIEVFDNSPSVSTASTFLDISDLVRSDYPEGGLLGLAFHPDFTNNGYFYVYYSKPEPHSMVLARYSVSPSNPNLADPDSELVLLDIPQDTINHKAGTLAFGPDGYLYLSVGDGSSTGDPDGHGQDKSTLRGSILRLDVDTLAPYGIPSDNPFVGEEGVREEIWAYGFRNPYRFSFDRLTGDLWAGDVGLQTREEIDVVVAGGNYGWNIWEGTYQRKEGSSEGFIFPVYEYDHSTVGGAAAVIGGHIYRGSIPSLQGKYLFADYLQPGRIKVLSVDRSDNFNVLSESEISLSNNSGITAIGEDEAGELYVSVIVTNVIYKIVQGSDDVVVGTEHCSDNVSDVNWAASGSDCPNLADFNLFVDPSNPLGGLNGNGVPFDLTTPLFSEYAHKYRQAFIPPETQVNYENGELVFPDGSILVKTFYYVDDERLPESEQAINLMETRLLVNRGTNGWASLAYIWDGDQATLALDGGEKSVSWIDKGGDAKSVNYGIPSRDQCEVCHTPIIEPLGPKIRHMNEAYAYSDTLTENQISHWSNIGILANAPADPGVLPRNPIWNDPSDGSLEERAFAYLDVNCGHCHNNSTGEALYTGLWLSSEQSGSITGICTPQTGGIAGYAFDIVPGMPEESLLIYRLASVEPQTKMPRLAKTVQHAEGLQLLSDWVQSLTGECD